LQAKCLTFSTPLLLTCCCHPLQHRVLHPLPLVVSSTAQLTHIICSPLLLCPPLPNCLVLFPLPPSSRCVVNHPIALHCVLHSPIASHCLLPTRLTLSTLPPLLLFPKALLPCIVFLPLLLCYPLPACPLHTLPQFDCCIHPHSLPTPPCCLLQRLLNTTSTIECTHPSLSLNTIFICHPCRLPCCPLPPSNTARCRSCQMPSSPPPLFAVLSPYVTATTFPEVYPRHKTPPPTIAICYCGLQMPSLQLLPFAVFHCRIHQTHHHPI
jgi:hypothetical protein